MKLDDTKRRLIIIGIALVFIMIGILQGAFKIKMNTEVVNQVSFILMMIAAWLLFSGRNTAKTSQEKPSESTPETVQSFPDSVAETADPGASAPAETKKDE